MWVMTQDAQDVGEPLFGTIAGEPSWEDVFANELPRVFNFLRYRLGSETLAEDLTSVTFEKAWRQRRRYRRDLAKFSTWLLSIARNAAIDHRRTERRHAPLEAADQAPAAVTPEDEAALQSNFARLSALLGQLGERERELLALKYGAGATNRAIAQVTGLSESNVGTILHRAVTTLRARW
jgi:RNA polymerase sigma-70 factor (ECF subfamily)